MFLSDTESGQAVFLTHAIATIKVTTFITIRVANVKMKLIPGYMNPDMK